MKVLKVTTTIITIVLIAWMLISWFDIVNNNNPFEEDGDPSNWNAFVVLTEVME